MSRHKPTVYVDPSINDCATALIVEAMDGINAECRAGSSYWLARDAVLSRAADGWVRAYGKPCADAAVRGLHCLAPDEVLEARTKRVQRDLRAAECRAHLTALDPTRDTWLNRWWISLTGNRLYALALAALIALLALQPAAPALARDGAHPDRWRALALCGVSKPGPDRERACWPFGAAERATYRGYDSPAGTPRSWELPRGYEIPN